MTNVTDLAHVARLIGDPARAAMLQALMDGRALTAGELAEVAGIGRPGASAHLAQMRDGGLLEEARQGRHRYFRLAGVEVAAALEGLMRLAPQRTVRTGPRDPDLRAMRVCYDHLAGPMAVHLADRMCALGWLAPGFAPTATGRARLAAFGLDLDALERAKRPLVRPCLDWSERRDHLAGGLGAALLARMVALGWLRRDENSRVVRFVGSGEAAFHAWLR